MRASDTIGRLPEAPTIGNCRRVRRRSCIVALWILAAGLQTLGPMARAQSSLQEQLLIADARGEWTLERYPRFSDSVYDSQLVPANYTAQEQIAPAPAEGDLGSSNTTLGEAPPDRELVFLRRQTVLLAPGESQFDIGIAYSYFDDERPVAAFGGGGAVVGVAEARVRQRLIAVPLEYRYGWSDGVQLFVNMPVGYSNAEFAFDGFKETEDDGGVGDLRAGSSIVLRYGSCGDPDVILTTGFTAPTGSGSYVAGGVVPNSQLGEGFWALNANLLFVHTYDPCVIYYGAGYNHRFDDTQLGVAVNPGEEINYQFGVGFAVNSRVTLSGSFQGAYLSEVEFDDNRIEGSTLEPMRMRFAVTTIRYCRIVEPFAEIPMTDDAAARIGVVWTY